jgi:hypothetical protein
LRTYTEKQRDTSQALANQLRAQGQFGPKRANSGKTELVKPAPSLQTGNAEAKDD